METVKKLDAAKLLGITVNELNLNVADKIKYYIPYTEYEKLVQRYGGDNAEELYKKGASVYYDKSGRYLLAIPFFERAASKGNIYAINALIEAYYKGLGVEKDVNKCVYYINKGIDLSSSYAIFMAAELSIKGSFLKKDVALGLKNLKVLDEVNYPPALLLLGKMYMFGYEVPLNHTIGVKYLERTFFSSSKEAVEAASILGIYYFSICKDVQTALPYLAYASNNGDIDATIVWGDIYYKGGNGFNQDYAKSFQLYNRAATWGSDIALNKIGIMYMSGLGVQKSFSKAAEVFTQLLKRAIQLR